MLAVRARMREPFEALLAFKGFLSGMQSPVFHQMVFVLESFLALITLVRPLIYQKIKHSLVTPDFLNSQDFLTSTYRFYL